MKDKLDRIIEDLRKKGILKVQYVHLGENNE